MTNPKDLQYDIIGDVHGHLNLLENLLIALGYEQKSGTFKHPLGRKAIFVGDLINRGPNSEGVLALVRKMHEEEEAIPVVGNHEFRIIQELVRFGKIDNSKVSSFVDWIRTWPLFLDLPELRVVHAAWHFSSISVVKNAKLDDDSFIERTWGKNFPQREAVDRILYGLKVSLPESISMLDRFEIKRKKGRIRWWESPDDQSFFSYLLSPMYPSPTDLHPKSEEVKIVEPYLFPEKPVFVGHYCLPPDIPKVSGQVVCLDGCVTCDKVLWAYRWKGEDTPVKDHLVCFPTQDPV